MTDDGRRVHWVGEDGRYLHPILNFTRPPLASGDEDEVTCRRCLHFIQENNMTNERITEVSATVDAGLTQAELDGMGEAERLALVVGSAYGAALAERDLARAHLAGALEVLTDLLDAFPATSFAHSTHAVERAQEFIQGIRNVDSDETPTQED